MWSAPGSASAAACVQSCCTSAPTCIGNSFARASPRHSSRSFAISSSRNPDANRPVSTWSGSLVAVAVLRPVPALKTSSSVAGSRPAVTPNVTASDVIASAVAESRLLSSFAICPWPGVAPTWNTFPPNSSSSGRTRSKTRSSPAAITASVRARAPATPPLTGASRTSMPLAASAAAISVATVAPVVERST